MKTFKRGSIVTNLCELLPMYGRKVIAVGTLGQVYRAKRNGVLNITFKVDGQNENVVCTTDKVQAAQGVQNMPVKGDIFYTSWGYEQTNIDYYQVVEVSATGKSITVRRIDGKERREPGSFMCGYVSPIKDSFRGEAETFRLNFDLQGNPGFKVNSYATATKADPTAEHFFSEWH